MLDIEKAKTNVVFLWMGLSGVACGTFVSEEYVPTAPCTLYTFRFVHGSKIWTTTRSDDMWAHYGLRNTIQEAHEWWDNKFPHNKSRENMFDLEKAKKEGCLYAGSKTIWDCKFLTSYTNKGHTYEAFLGSRQTDPTEQAIFYFYQLNGENSAWKNKPKELWGILYKDTFMDKVLLVGTTYSSKKEAQEAWKFYERNSYIQLIDIKLICAE